MRNRRSLILRLLVLATLTSQCVLPARAQTMDRETAKAQGQALGTSGGAAAQNNALNPDLSNVPGYSTSNPPQTQYNDGNMWDAGQAEANVNEAAQLLQGSYTTRPRYDISTSDPWLQHSWDVSADPHSVVDQFTGKYQDCAPIPGGSWPAPTEYRQCNVWQDFAENSCTIGQVVEVSGGNGYACMVGQDYENATCEIQKNVQVIIDGVACNGSSFGNWYSSRVCYVRGTFTVEYDGYFYCSGGSLYKYERVYDHTGSNYYYKYTGSVGPIDYSAGSHSVGTLGGGSTTISCNEVGACSYSTYTTGSNFTNPNCNGGLSAGGSFQLGASFHTIESETSYCGNLEGLQQ